MNELPLISVIIPIHNAKEFLDECLNSIITQTYQNLEIILINDDSQDGSQEIIENYKKQDNRIKDFLVKNNNAAQTRRVGVRRSSAKYVCFVDADDIIDKRYVELLYFALKKANAKISSGEIYSFTEFTEIKISIPTSQEVKIEKDMLAYFGNNYHSSLPARHIAQSLNAKLFMKEVFLGIDYTVIKSSILEDNYIMAQILHNIKPQKIALIDYPIYYYRYNSQSTMGTALDHLILYGKEQISYPTLFEKTMEYISDLYKDNPNVTFYINKIRAEEYYNLAETVVNRNIRIKYAEKLLDEANNHIDALESKNKKLEKENENLITSKTYHVIRFITFPYRFIKTRRYQK